MSVRRIKSRTTEGLNADIFITKGLAYSVLADYKTFGDSAADGEFGVFLLVDGDDQNAAIKSTALASGDEFFIAQSQLSPRDGSKVIKKTRRMLFDDILASRKKKSGFVLPTKQVSHVGYNGSGGDFETAAIAKDDEFGFSVLLTTEGYQPFPTWNFTYSAKTNDTNVEVADGIIRQVNDPQSLQNKENSTVVKAETLLEGTDTAISGGETLTAVYGEPLVVSSGATHGVVAGDYLRIGGAGEGSYLVKEVAGANITLFSNFVGTAGAGLAGDIMTAITATGIQVTTLEEQDHFRLAVKSELSDTSISYTTPFKQGSGYRDHITNLEYEGQIFDGTKTVNAAFNEKYGEQTNYRNSTYAYDLYILPSRGTESSKAIPNTETTHFANLIIAAPLDAATPANDEGYVDAPASANTELDTIFGF